MTRIRIEKEAVGAARLIDSTSLRAKRLSISPQAPARRSSIRSPA